MQEKTHYQLYPLSAFETLKCNFEIFNYITHQIYILEAEALAKKYGCNSDERHSSDSDKEIHRILENKRQKY